MQADLKSRDKKSKCRSILNKSELFCFFEKKGVDIFIACRYSGWRRISLFLYEAFMILGEASGYPFPPPDGTTVLAIFLVSSA